MNGIPLFIPYSLRSKAIAPFTETLPVPSRSIVKVNFSDLVTPRIVKSPAKTTILGPAPVALVE
jgi:hypothetical protein